MRDFGEGMTATGLAEKEREARPLADILTPHSQHNWERCRGALAVFARRSNRGASADEE